QRALVGAAGLLGCIIVGTIGWYNQAFLKEQYRWRTVMRPNVLTSEQERMLRTRQEFKECAHGCPMMVVVPAGTFMMGSPENDKDHKLSEGPQHEVTIGKPFAVGKFVVTFEEWDQCTEAGACPRAPDNSWGRRNQPVINVSWEDAKTYVSWLSRLTGKDYRLLSEAEFEYAARAGSTTAYPWGDPIGKGNANCNGCGSEWG